MRRLLTLRGFEKWLRSKPASFYVGQAVTLACCPIATYLTETEGEVAQVHNSSYRVGDCNSRPLPPWAREFIERVDRRRAGYQYTARGARRILRNVTGR